ncbi:hypothetical protein ACOME3_002164 [Neoechinorhynchus agilis]
MVSVERVIVQNILHGLSPSLSDAIEAIPRWSFLRASLPHIMHSCAAIIERHKLTPQMVPESTCETTTKGSKAQRQKGSTNVSNLGTRPAQSSGSSSSSQPNVPVVIVSPHRSTFDKSEVKLLYALHWILLDAASECFNNQEYDASTFNEDHQLMSHSIGSIQLFVYLFAPLIHLLDENDFEDLRLKPALRLWKHLWLHNQPVHAIAFSRPVKPSDPSQMIDAIRNVTRLSSKRCIGSSVLSSSDLDQRSSILRLSVPIPPSGKSPAEKRMGHLSLLSQGPTYSDNDDFGNLTAPLAHMSSVCGGSGEDALSGSSNKNDNSQFCPSCNQLLQPYQPICQSCGRPVSDYIATDSHQDISSTINEYEGVEHVKMRRRTKKGVQGNRTSCPIDTRKASFLDVAVVRALFSPGWKLEGFVWCLEYLSNRISAIADQVLQQPHFRLKSNSYPKNLCDIAANHQLAGLTHGGHVTIGDQDNAGPAMHANELLRVPVFLNNRIKLITFYRKIR